MDIRRPNVTHMANAKSTGLKVLQPAGHENSARLQRVAHLRRRPAGRKSDGRHSGRSTSERRTLVLKAKRGNAAMCHRRHVSVAAKHGIDALLVDHAQRLGHLHDAVDRRRARWLGPGLGDGLPNLCEIQ